VALFAKPFDLDNTALPVRRGNCVEGNGHHVPLEYFRPVKGDSSGPPVVDGVMLEGRLDTHDQQVGETHDPSPSWMPGRMWSGRA
jgi:hypothetical protein